MEPPPRVQMAPALQRAAEALAKGRRRYALNLIRQYIEKAPRDLRARVMLNSTLIEMNRLDEAEESARRLIAHLPDHPRTNAHLAMIAARRDRLDEAATLFTRAIAADPQELRWRRLLLRVLTSAGRLDEAEKLTREIVAMDPESVEARLALGDLLRTVGRGAEAAQVYADVLQISPGNGAALWSLARYGGAEIDGLDATIEQALGSGLAEGDDKALLHFARAELHAKAGRHAQAFADYEAANALFRESRSFDSEAYAEAVQIACRRLGKTRDAETVSAPDEDATPIFIVGMPRAGSTLLERMLGCHSRVEALGELETLDRLVKAHLQPPATAQEIAALGEEYRRCVAARRKGDTPFFTDKMHMNWRHVHLILQALPDARIVDIRRDAMDCCWSNYTYPFQAGHPASADLAWIGAYYRGYAKVMDRARAAFPDRVYRLDYESLVDDPQLNLRDLAQWLGIEFEAAMEDFHLSQAPTATASSHQVRQPLNRKGLGAHRPYREWLGPLADSLDTDASAG